MAVVGEAHIIVRAITTEVRKDIRNGFKGLKGQATEAGTDIGRSFSKGMAGEMMQAQKSFSALMRKGYYLQSGLGALAGSVGALAGGLGALAGVSLSAGSAMTVLANGMIQVKVASAVGKLAFSGVSQAVSAAGKATSGTTKSIKELREEMQQLAFDAEEAALGEQGAAIALEKAREELARSQNLPPDNRARRESELAYYQADLAYRKAKDRNKDLQDEINNPAKKAKTGADPYAGLTKTQKEFAQYLVSIRGKMAELKEAAASSFLPEIQSQMETFFAKDYFGALRDGISELSNGLAQATRNFGNTFLTNGNMANLSQLFKDAAGSMASLGSILGNTMGGLLSYLKATNPLLTRFLTFLNFKSEVFARNMRNNQASITAFFKVAGDNAAIFGDMFSNIWVRVKTFIKNTTGPGSGGEMLLMWMRDLSGAFLKADQTVRNSIMRKYYADSAENLKQMLTTLGHFVKTLGRLGANPAVGKFWATLDRGAESLESILENSVDAAPALAELIVQITRSIAAFSDSEQVKAFFNTMSFAMRVIANTLEDLKPFLDRLGPIIGVLSAFGGLSLLFLKLGKILGGFIILALKPLLFLIGAVAPAAGKAAIGMGIFSGAAATGLKAISAAIIQVPVVGWLLGIVAALGTATAAFAMWSSDTSQKAEDAGVALANAGAGVKALWNVAKAPSDATTFFNTYGNSADDLKGRLKQLADAQDYIAKGATILNSTTIASASDTAGQFERMGASIAAIANKKGVPSAIKAFNEFNTQMKLSPKEIRTTYLEMDKYRKIVQDHADALGISIRNTKGEIDVTKELEVATGKGAYATKMAALEQQRFNKVIADGVNSFIDLNRPLQQNKEEVRKWAESIAKSTKDTGDSWKDYYKNFDSTGFSLDKYMADLQAQVDAAAAFGDNLIAISNKPGITRGTVERIAGMGQQGAAIAAALALENDKKKLEGYEATFSGQLTTNIGGQIAAAFSIQSIGEAAIKKHGTAVGQHFASAAASGLTPSQLMKKFGLKFKDLMAPATEQDPVTVDAQWSQDTVTKLRSELTKGISNVKLYAKKDGGLIGNNMYDPGFSTLPGAVYPKNGGFIKKFGLGGEVFGPGGPRADMVPAMLSNGEFVVNTAATRNNLELLQAINSGNARDILAGAGGGTTNQIGITVNAAAGMSEKEIANLVVSQLQFQMRKGASI